MTYQRLQDIKTSDIIGNPTLIKNISKEARFCPTRKKMGQLQKMGRFCLNSFDNIPAGKQEI